MQQTATWLAVGFSFVLIPLPLCRHISDIAVNTDWKISTLFWFVTFICHGNILWIQSLNLDTLRSDPTLFMSLFCMMVSSDWPHFFYCFKYYWHFKAFGSQTIWPTRAVKLFVGGMSEKKAMKPLNGLGRAPHKATHTWSAHVFIIIQAAIQNLRDCACSSILTAV